MPKSPIGQAISYCLSDWAALTGNIEDGDLNIDNNPAENALCGVVIGRKNWLFAGNECGGKTAAILCTFIASAKRHGIDPYAYLRDVLAGISDQPIDDLDRFLPDRC